MSRLARAVAGDPDLPPILAHCWAALSVGLNAAPSGAWIDGERLADSAADLAGCSPSLADGLLDAAVASGQVQRHRTRQALVRLAPTTPGRNRDRASRNTRRER